MKIDIHHHLLHNRRNAVAEKPAPGEKWLWRAFAFLMRRPFRYRLLGRFGPIAQIFHPLVQGTAADPVRAWTATRDFPKAASRTFRDEWLARKGAAK